MNKFIIGLTGGIGSGKTTVSNYFADLNIDIVDADIVARDIVQPGSVAITAIKKYFGDGYVDNNQILNRTKLRTRIFSNEIDKQWLNNLLHPLIRKEIERQITSSSSLYCILAAPLLIENKLSKLVNRVLVVDISEENQVLRTTARDPSSADEVRKIIASQIPREARLKFADDIINNQNNTLLELRTQVIEADKHYRELAKKYNKS